MIIIFVTTSACINGKPSFRDAVANRMYDVVEDYLLKGADPDARLFGEDTGLLYTARFGDCRMALIFVKYRADLNAKSQRFFGRTPLHLAASENNTKGFLEILVPAGADIDAIDDTGNTPLIISIESKNNINARCLIDLGANIHVANNYGGTAISRAVSKGNYDIIELLLKRGANVNVRDKNGETLLSIAIGNDDIRMVQFLIKHGADLNDRSKNPLVSAIYSRNIPIIKYLLSIDAVNVNILTGRDGITPLRIAKEIIGNSEIIDLLIANGAIEFLE
jgi:hypothetical protein